MKLQGLKYDYYLIILTTFILFAIGIVCLYAITYYNYLAVDPQWTRTGQYMDFINSMDSYLYPFLILLLVTLGLCIPKRLLDRDILVKFCALALGVTLILTFSSGIEAALGFLLVVMIGIQSYVLILVFRRSKAVRFEKEGYVVRLGSTLLHLGIVIVIFNFVNLREAQFHIPVFWIGTLLITAGNIFSFYPARISSLFHTK
ncbi:MAG: hypothetical protein OIN89_08630 [Candidatus Methanoperedens sp.]|jgi:hypothetical protein|nr:hypothetical protein [Candidatus Methanoperedens sp.]PKL53334.1 MAG: hypothetical protein CVV36_07645 [Candidatus Methanoperedenaceae archaeon HGW-Methanoperedenaceae-1]